MLPLELNDLYIKEYDLFIEEYEDRVDLDDAYELSSAIWEFAQNRIDDLSDFFLIPHAWLEVNFNESSITLIVDITVDQFENAVNGSISKENYKYKKE